MSERENLELSELENVTGGYVNAGLNLTETPVGN